MRTDDVTQRYYIDYGSWWQQTSTIYAPKSYS